MERTGTGQLFMDFAMSLTGAHRRRTRQGVGACPRALFGTISGSAVANVMVDGPISIPLMKRSGFPPHFAAGVEAMASTGGQIMPPIMGAAAFVMAEFLGVSYGQVVIWAIIPAILYYVACFAAVHFEAKRRGLVGVPRAELPRLGQVMRERGHLFIPVLAILVVMYSGYSAPLAALAGTLACFPVAALRKSTRHYVTLRNFIDACVDGARNALPVALACAAAGIVIGVVTLSGLGIVFTQFVVALSQNYPAAGADPHHDRRHRARHGHADHAGLHHHDGAAGAGDRQARRDHPGRAHVRLLLRDPVGDHAAGRAGGLCGRRPRQIRPVEDRLGGGADRGDQLHRAVHVRL